MAIYERPPKAPYDLLMDYLSTNYPDQSVSSACDAGRRLIHLEMPDMDDADFSVLLQVLQNKFPGAF